ncbi:DNase I-like protein, partial [Trametes sanguinea]
LYINQIMRDKRLDILALQEAHLSDDRLNTLNTLFGTSLLILSSQDPDNDRGARGVAFVISKARLAERLCSTIEVVPGRALLLKYPWTPTKSITLLCVYAPNRPADNAEFWNAVHAELNRLHIAKPEILLGDFNVVESALDRSPAHADPTAATEALASLTLRLRVRDAWRCAHRNERCYTYKQQGGTCQSRLDRIYASSAVIPAIADWAVVGPGPLSDHQMVLCSIANYHAPKVGTGCWMAPLALLEDATFTKTMHALGRQLQTNLTDIVDRTADMNPQRVYQDFKVKLVKAARGRAKEWMPKLDKHIELLRQEVQRLRNA